MTAKFGGKLAALEKVQSSSKLFGPPITIKQVVENDKPNRLFVEHKNGKTEELYLNDPLKDGEELDSYGVGNKIVTFMSDKEINGIMSSSGMTHKNLVSRWGTAATESTHDMDFGVKYSGADPETDKGGFVVFGSDKQAYNLMDGGNFLWGKGWSA